jgi:hypothetical protein
MSIGVEESAAAFAIMRGSCRKRDSLHYLTIEEFISAPSKTPDDQGHLREESDTKWKVIVLGERRGSC